MANFSDFIVFIDESGDYSLSSISSDFPIFALAACVIDKEDYCLKIVPAFQEFKFRYWGHDATVLHEREIRREENEFAFLRKDRNLRECFLADLNDLMANARVTVFASVIDKTRLRDHYSDPRSPYDLALHSCLEGICDFLVEREQRGRLAHVLFEKRGHREDRDLELDFRRICEGNQEFNYLHPRFKQMRFKSLFLKKSANSTGLQIADLIARPVALHELRPHQQNRAFNIIEPKLGKIERRP